MFSGMVDRKKEIINGILFYFFTKEALWFKRGRILESKTSLSKESKK